MIEYAKDNQAKETVKETVKDVVCPNCFKSLPYPRIVRQQPDRYGRVLRTYFGWCFECNCGFEVIQFEKDNRWFIHKYQRYSVVGQDIHCLPSGRWQILNALPEPPVVVIGPGGSYDRPLNPELIRLFDSIRKALNSCGQILEQLIRQKTEYRSNKGTKGQS